MSEFSKQYCETHDMGCDGDFDILDEWNRLQPGYCVALICEGYGFTNICKTEDGQECLLYFPDGDEYGTHWVNYFKLDLM